LTSGTAVFPEPPDQAMRAGRFARVPVVNGSNRDEGRTFMAGAIGWSRHQYVGWLRSLAGDLTPRILRRYPWPAQSDRFTAAYLSGAIVTDSGIYGIGGCATLQLDRTLARWVPTYAYEFHARRGPGLTPIPGYVWGAGHAAELAYLFPSFDNGTPIAPTFNAGERQLSRDMIRWWSAFVFAGRPNAQGLPTWRAFNADHQIMSLRPGGRSHLESAASFRRAHQCGFWNSLLQSPADARLLAARPLA
jgi:para-nitrobenzyl esterase